jgi:excisionase family DNA binding protein
MTPTNRSSAAAFVVPGIGRFPTLGIPRPEASGDKPSPWLDVKAAGAYVGFSEKTIRRACATRGLRHVRVGRSIRIRREWLDAWLTASDT